MVAVHNGNTSMPFLLKTLCTINLDTGFNCPEYFVKASMLWLIGIYPMFCALYVVINSPSPATIFYKSTFYVVFNKSSALHETLNLFHWLENIFLCFSESFEKLWCRLFPRWLLIIIFIILFLTLYFVYHYSNICLSFFDCIF